MKNLKLNSIGNVTFTRAIRPDEKKDYGQTIVEGKKFVGIENLAIVLHGSSFPQADKDLFIGSPFNEKAKEVNEFLKMHGFDSIQLGPPGKISESNVSPYSASVNSKNYLFADMNQLTKDDYANILSPTDIDKQTSNSYKTSTQTDFEKAFKSYDILFEKAFENLRNKNDANAIQLKSEFKEFKKTAGDWLETDALFEVLKKTYNTPNIDKWPEISKNLISYKNDPASLKHNKALNLIKELKRDNAKELQIYKFKQFIMDKQEKEFIKENPDKLNYISDAIIGFSMQDYWANQEAFLKDYRVGCPYGGAGYPEGQGTPRGANQMWDIPVINPKALFNEDGSLGKGSELLRKKFEKLLDSYQNIRIDHALGLVDPWIYNKNNVEIRRDETGRIVYSNANGANLSKFGKENAFWIEDGWDEYTKNIYRDMNYKLKTVENLDTKGDYPKILEKILLPLLEEKGLKPNELVWEDLGCPSDVFSEVYYSKLKLPSLVSLKGEQGQGKSPNNWFLISSHDDPPFVQVATNEFFGEKKYPGGSMDPMYLMGFIHPEKDNGQREELMKNSNWETRLRVVTKYQELLRCAQKAQISFMDFFGLDKTYNKMGTDDKENWKLRLSKDYQRDYYKTLEEKDYRKIALNMPELLKRAVISKIYTSNKSDIEKAQDFTEAKPLIDKLDHYKKVLYEHEE